MVKDVRKMENAALFKPAGPFQVEAKTRLELLRLPVVRMIRLAQIYNRARQGPARRTGLVFLIWR